MIERIRPRMIVCRARPRRMSLRLMVAAATLACGALPLLEGAQATRRAPAEPALQHDVSHEVPGSITLAEMIEIQRAKRRAAIAARSSAALSRGAAWNAQFGAFTSPQPAVDLAGRLAASPLSKLATIEVASLEGMHRVRAGAADQAAAASICAAAQDQGAACFVRRR